MQILLPSVYYIVGVIYFLYFIFSMLNTVKYKTKLHFCFGTLALSITSFSLASLFNSDHETAALISLVVAGSSLLVSSGLFLYMVVLTSPKKRLWDNVILFLTFATALLLPLYVYVKQRGGTGGPVVVLEHSNIYTISGSISVFKVIYALCLIAVLATCILKIMGSYTPELLVRSREKYRGFVMLCILDGVILVIDIVYKFIDDFSLPPFSVIVTVVLIGYAVFFNLKTEELMVKAPDDDELYIIEGAKKRQLYSVVSYAILILAFFGHAVNYIYLKQYGWRYDLSMLYCMFVGLAVLAIQYRGKGILSDVISNMLWVSILPVAFTSFPYFSHTVLLMVPCIFALIGCIYVDRIFIFLFAVSGLMTYLVVILYDPFNSISLTSLDITLRLLIYGATMYIILLVHKSFVYRIKQLRRHEFFQMAVVNLSQWLVLSKDMDIGYRIEEALKSILEFTQSDRVFVYRLNADTTVFSLISSCEKEDSSLAKLPSTIKKYALSDKINVLLKGQVVIFNQKKEREYQFLQLESVSTVYIPMNHKDNPIGMIGIQSQEEQDFTSLDKELFKIIANMLSNAIMTSEVDRMIEHNSTYDILTQLPNRTYFTDILNYRIEQSNGTDKKLIIVFIDLDAFQEINDLMGHDFGDKILVDVAMRFSRALDNKAVVSRFGGDEFLILFNDDIEIEEMERIMEMLMSLFVEPFRILNNEMYLSISCGIAIYPFDGTDSKTLIKNADMAMNEAKISGKGRYVFCSDQMKKNLERRALLIEHLRKALANDEFSLVFQPQVDSVTHKIKGAEALLRWFPSNTEELGNMVSPGEFIPLLEETGMIVEVGRFVVEEAARVIKNIKESGLDDIIIAVNMSVEQCKDLGIISFLYSQIQKYEINPKLIDVEVTESAYADAHENVRFLIDEMIKLGVSISIDDFGTGYSNMSRLSRINIDKIKIDISYVRGIGVSDKDEGIVVTIINLAKSLGCITLAEGVETKEQLDFLATEGCELIQGYYFYKPLTEEEFLKTLFIAQRGVSAL